MGATKRLEQRGNASWHPYGTHMTPIRGALKHNLSFFIDVNMPLIASSIKNVPDQPQISSLCETVVLSRKSKSKSESINHKVGIVISCAF